MKHYLYKCLLRSVTLSLLIVIGGLSSARANDTLSRIADDVVKQTILSLPESEKPEATRYNLWMYQNQMIMEGMNALGKMTDEKRYLDYTSQSIDFFADYQSKFGDSMTAGPAGQAKWYSRPREMWQCGMIATFAERHQTRPHPEFIKGMAVFDRMIKKAPTLKNGVLVRNKKNFKSLGLQIDDLYMIAPYWARKAKLLNDPKWLDRAIDESLHYFDYLWNKEDQLMHPLWLQKDGSHYGQYWGRGNGWYIMAVTDLLTFIPEDHPKRKEVLKDYRTFIKGIVLRQNEDGLWHQILNRPDSYAETSCSGMFTYCILKGVNEGWLDESFSKHGRLGWKGLLSKVNENFEITGVCPPSDIYADPKKYLHRGPEIHDQHAIGPFLLAGAAYLEANKE